MEERYNRSVEIKWQEYWKEKDTYKFDEVDSSRPIYSIDTPPPFTSGDLHMGHVLSYSYFDFIARYKRMKGFNVYYPQGWDCQGFPTEVKVEQKYGRKPPEEFRSLCIEWTNSCIEKMKAQMNSMGFSPDWRYEYKTMSPEYHKAVQHSLIKMYEKGLVFRAKHPVFWCPNCRSALAKSDTEELERDSQLNFLKFTGPNGQAIPIATSRAELLHACVAVLFNPTDKRYANYANETITTPLGNKVKMMPDKDVDMNFGSGALMVCTFGDKMDVVWMYRYGLPIIEAFDASGRIINGPDYLNGLKAPEAKKKIIERLGEEGKVIKIEPLHQAVKVHDRCKKPVELMLSTQWFGKIKGKDKEIIEAAKTMRWVPDFAISHLVDWASNVEWDWVISRQRVFGTPLPFWYCAKCNKDYTASLDELPVNPPLANAKACECGETLVAESSTCDCWIDSSITPLVISGWPGNQSMFKKFYPISLRPQGVEIIRTWAYYTIYRCMQLAGRPPFKELLLNGNVLAPDGKKMSKSLGNIIAPDKLIDDYYADSVRQWAALSGAMAKDRPFSYQDLTYSKSFLNKLWNAAKFASQSISGFEPDGSELASLETVDRWILSRLQGLIYSVSEDFENFEYHHAIKSMQEFFWHEVCDFYLEYVKYRIYQQGTSSASKRAAQFTLHTVLLNTIKLLAPIAPHVTEEIFTIFSGQEGAKASGGSIHTSSWPAKDDRLVFPDAEKTSLLLNQIVSQVRQFKASNKLALNTPIESLQITSPEDLASCLEVIKATTGAKSVSFAAGELKLKIVS
ncbi:valine--tRNA ligase [Candidatus Parvarchaeota archaeon]|nr:valine--tRNA ligase [Candidatus Parvarchaeota archaeon]